MCLLALLLAEPVYADEEILIGLRAHSGKHLSMQQWQPTADYLSTRIQGYTFRMVPYELLTEMQEAVARKEVDFVLTNPSSAVELEVKYGISHLATLMNRRQDKAYLRFGAVIFTRQDNKEINSLGDLKGRHFVAVSPKAFGGWQMTLRELKLAGIDPEADFKRLDFTDGIQEAVVHAVLNKRADAGTVRTDMLERMAARGEINLQDIKIIGQKQTEGFPFYHSTQLYPEWPFSKLAHVSRELSRKITLALLTMPEKHAAADSGKYVGWTVVENYQPVYELMEELKIGPFKVKYEPSMASVVQKYGWLLLAVLAGAMIVIVIVIYVVTINSRLHELMRKLESSNQELEGRVQDRTRALSLAKEEAEQASRAKSDFLSSVTHELRTPLNAILGFSRLMSTDKSGQLQASQQECLDEISDAGGRLLDIINDLLDLSRIEAGKYSVQKEEFTLEILIEEIDTMFRGAASKADVTLVFEKICRDCMIYTDHTLVGSVMSHLVTNAIRYNKPGGQVKISCYVTEDNKYLRLIVEDTGIGIPDDIQKKIFLPFERAEDSMHVQGTGVGLAVTAGLVRLLGGDIQVKSRYGEGSRFSIELPIQAHDAAQTASVAD